MINNTISVIVPIYNVEEYLPKCIESICNQSYKNLEIILVNDGSPDRCGEICEKYANKDNRIKVIHKTNGGLSDARNVGLRVAKGEYISFVDSDDYIEEESYEILIKNAVENNLDIVAANAWLTEDDHFIHPLMKEKRISNEITTGVEYMCESIMQNSFHVCVWLNLYKKKLLIDNKLFFQKGLLHEDEEWTPRVFLEAERVKYIDYKFYMYVTRAGSITRSKDRSKNGMDILDTCYKLEKLYDNRLTKKQKKIMNSYLLNLFLGAVYLGRLERPYYKKKVRKSFVFGKIHNIKAFMKSLLFLTSLRLYSEINQLSKRKS